MITTIFLFLTILNSLVTPSAFHGGDIGKCIDNQVDLSTQDKIHFVALGDWGDGHIDQEEVATALGEFCFHNRCDFIVSTGDNIYNDGVESPFDEQLDEKWKNVYNHPSIADLPWYMTVGNHDHHTPNGEWFQVEYSEIEPRWNFPCLAHSFNVTSQATSVMFVSVDTVSIDDDINDAESQKQLLDSELGKAGEDAWKIVFGHFPCHSGGGYSGITSTRQQILPIMRRHNVDFYLTGHDHNLQHWRTKGDFADVEHIVTGAGGKNAYSRNEEHVARNEAMGMELHYFTDHYGFSYFSISNTEIEVKFVGADGATIYQYTRGASPPVTLPPTTDPSRPLEQCDEWWWPDLDHGLVCGDCKVLVHEMKERHPTCSSYCSLVGRVCTGAWEEDHDTCGVLSTETCEHDFGSYTSDAICECRDPGMCDESSWPDVDQNTVCGDCKVLVTHMNSVYHSCSNYCSSLGRKCTGAWEEDHDSCGILSTEDCHHDFGSYTSDAICECGSLI